MQYPDYRAGSSLVAEMGNVVNAMGQTRNAMSEGIMNAGANVSKIAEAWAERKQKQKQFDREYALKEMEFAEKKRVNDAQIRWGDDENVRKEKKLPSEIKQIESSANLQNSNAANNWYDLKRKKEDDAYIRKNGLYGRKILTSITPPQNTTPTATPPSNDAGFFTPQGQGGQNNLGQNYNLGFGLYSLGKK